MGSRVGADGFSPPSDARLTESVPAAAQEGRSRRVVKLLEAHYAVQLDPGFRVLGYP